MTEWSTLFQLGIKIFSKLEIFLGHGLQAWADAFQKPFMPASEQSMEVPPSWVLQGQGVNGVLERMIEVYLQVNEEAWLPIFS